jgi:hypothetical protein
MLPDRLLGDIDEVIALGVESIVIFILALPPNPGHRLTFQVPVKSQR